MSRPSYHDNTVTYYPILTPGTYLINKNYYKVVRLFRRQLLSRYQLTFCDKCNLKRRFSSLDSLKTEKIEILSNIFHINVV